jgi:hypothetical protein
VELTNATRMVAGYTMGIDPSAREHIVVVVKGTFRIPDKDSEAATLADEQVPLVMADTFTGEPGYSAPVHEADFPLRKKHCDILLNATAYAPEGRPAPRVRVGVKVGGWSKVIDVLGDRVWRQAGVTLGSSAPAPFTTMPVTYNRAFGGVDNTDPERSDAYMPNPVGRGYGLVRSGERLIGRPLPNTEDPRDPVTVPWGAYRPMALGPVGRGWRPRLNYAGTYDQSWIDNTFPFLPADFDDRYHQAAAEDQQVEPLQGGEEVVLVNLTPRGRTAFRLPMVEVPVVFIPRDGEKEETRATLDTVLIEPDQGRVCLAWRTSRPLRRNIFELPEAVVGRMSRVYWRARELGKEYHPSLGALVRSRRREVEEV